MSDATDHVVMSWMPRAPEEDWLVEGTLLDTSPPDEAAARQMRAWLALDAALALHVVDEALTGFLGFYNTLVQDLRSRLPGFPVPTFTFGTWLIGLAALVVLLGLLGPAVRRGVVGTRLASWALGAIMFLNGMGHLAGSVYFRRWLPGATTAPLLLLASLWLAHSTYARGRRGAVRSMNAA